VQVSAEGLGAVGGVADEGRAGLTFLMFLATYVTLSQQLSVMYMSTKNRLHGGILANKRRSHTHLRVGKSTLTGFYKATRTCGNR
jgi:hypothetical protein